MFLGLIPHTDPRSSKYRRYWKQFLAYYYRVVYSNDGHFTKPDRHQRTPADSIRPTAAQDSAWAGVVEAALDQDREALRGSLSAFSMAIICHEFGGSRYSSPLLSFCAMPSVKPFKRVC